MSKSQIKVSSCQAKVMWYFVGAETIGKQIKLFIVEESRRKNNLQEAETHYHEPPLKLGWITLS